MIDTTGLAAANNVRSAMAAERNAARARTAMRWLELERHTYGTTQAERDMVARYRKAVRARMEWPGLTLAELAEKCGVSKDAYSARLRRGLELAERAELAAL